MRKILSLLTAALLAAALFAGCAGNGDTSEPSSDKASSAPVSTDAASSEAPTAEKTAIRIGGLKGPTSMGLVKLMEDDSNGSASNEYEFTIAGSADEITPKLVKGELDMAAVPANLASVLYNNNDGAFELLAINTLGVIYIVEKGDSIASVSDLKGKTIYATGKGSTPEYALRYILSQNGIDPDNDLTIEWQSEPSAIVSLLSSADSGIAMLPQPYVTVAQNSVEGLRIAVDLTKAWDDLKTGSALITGVMVVRRDFAEKNPEAIAKFLAEYEVSAKYTTDNVDDAAALIEKYDIVKAVIAKKAIPYCNITFVSGSEMKTLMTGYLQVLFDQNAKSIGGKLPGDDFYYGAE